MATIGQNKFGLTLFGSISLFFLTYVLVFTIYQYHREQEFLKELGRVHVTIINTEGEVLMDTEKDPSTMPNHLQRHEVQQALKEGYGFDIARTSAKDGERYFYSATYFPNSGKIIRSAVPYPGDRKEAPITNRGYVLISIAIFLLLSAVLYIYTRRVGQHVNNTIAEYRKQVREAESEKIRIKQQLTQNTAHELKTPAASIQGYLETLIKNPNLPTDQRRHFTERAYSQAQRMSALLKDMGTLTRLDEQVAEHYLQYQEQIDLAMILNNVLDDISLVMKEKHIVVSKHISSCQLQGNAGLWYSVFRNILDNSIAYSDATMITVKVKDKEILIADDGIGIPAEHLPHIFERFYLLDKGRSREMGGTGLGLAIVKNAVILHGGKVSAEIVKPHGLAIRIML